MDDLAGRSRNAAEFEYNAAKNRGVSPKKMMYYAGAAGAVIYLGSKTASYFAKLKYEGNITKISRSGKDLTIRVDKNPPSGLDPAIDKIVIGTDKDDLSCLDGTHRFKSASASTIVLEVPSSCTFPDGTVCSSECGTLKIDPGSIWADVANDPANVVKDVLASFLNSLGLGQLATKFNFFASLSSSACCIICAVVIFMIMKRNR
jgi:hypothetical protein